MTDPLPPEGGPRKPLLSRISETVTVSSVGLEIGFSVAIGALAGYWLDGKLDTGPWLTVVGLLFGVASAGKRLYEIARMLSREPGEGKGRDDDKSG